MPGALGDVLDAIQTGLSQIPPALYVIGLLFGPTAAYIGYRLYAQPRTTKALGGEVEDLFWICPECRSANEVRRRRCYHCSADREAIAGALRVVDRDQVLELEDEPGSPGIAVGPGKAPAGAPAPTMSETPPDPVVARPLASLASRPRMAIPIEPEDDVMAASQPVAAGKASSARPAKRSRSSRRDVDP